jgi:hypothetical protein
MLGCEHDKTEGQQSQEVTVRVATWNIAAINNNPFEYWITSPDPAYSELMQGVQNFMESAGNDRYIHEIFTDQMFMDLIGEMVQHKFEGIEPLKELWNEDYRNRYAIQDFLKDQTIGEKRLASMPDRITNTINLSDGTKCMRPTAINAFDGEPLDSIDKWWELWKKFIFHTHVQIYAGSRHNSNVQLVCSLIGPILRSKYPAITSSEQAMSIPLQFLCLAILDAIFIHMLNHVDPEWEKTRRLLCNALIKEKTTRVCAIISEYYQDMDVIFIQEAAAIFVRQVLHCPRLNARFRALAPRTLDGKRDQNSLILLSRERFGDEGGTDVTAHAVDSMGGAWVAPGDLLVVRAESADGVRWLLASFHGDSNGLSTQPVVQAVQDLARERYPDHALVLGLDANTQSRAADAYHHGVEGFCRFLKARELVSAWGEAPDPGLWTTCNSRTFLQTQLNKATPHRERAAESQQNLKDWVVACGRQVMFWCAYVRVTVD